MATETKDYVIYENALISNTGVICTDKIQQQNFSGLWNHNTHIVPGPKSNEKGLSVLGYLAENPLHYVANYLGSFKSLEDYDLSDYKVFLHDNSVFKCDWLRIIRPDISYNQIISPEVGFMYAKRLIALKAIVIPWGFLHSRVIDFLPKNLPQDVMVLVKRNNNRIMENWNGLKKICEKYCKEFNLKLYIHDDSNMPNVENQLKAFNSAKIVIGSHGAGFINLLGCQSNTFLIECKYMDRKLSRFYPKVVHGEEGDWFFRLSRHLNIHYQKTSIINRKADLNEIELAFQVIKNRV
jgi:hypothetical protein